MEKLGKLEIWINMIDKNEYNKLTYLVNVTMVICLLVRDAKWWEIVFEAHFCFVANQEREFRKGDKLTPPQRAKRVIKGEG